MKEKIKISSKSAGRSCVTQLLYALKYWIQHLATVIITFSYVHMSYIWTSVRLLTQCSCMGMVRIWVNPLSWIN